MALAQDDLGLDVDFGHQPASWPVREVQRTPARPIETRLGRRSLRQMRESGVKALPWVVKGCMVEKEQSMLAGESQSGKSFLALHIGMSIASGLPVFGMRTAPGLVIYQAGESGSGVSDLRVPAWLKHYGADVGDIPFEVLTHKVDLWSPEGNAKLFIEVIRNIAAEYATIPLRAVFIDTLSKAMAGANENDGRDVSRVLANAELISRETGAHVCIVHHFPKGGKTLRGHGSLKADVDSVALLTVDEQKVRKLTFDKMKDGAAGGSIEFELMQVKLDVVDEDGDPVTSCVCLPVGEKAARRTDAFNSVRLSTNELGLFQAFWQALQRFGGFPHPSLDCPPSVRVAPYDEVRRLYVDASPMQDAEVFETEEAREDARRRHEDRLRKQMQRACTDLNRKWKVIRLGKAPDPDTGKPVDYAWWTGRAVRDMPETYPPKPKDEPVTPDLDGLDPDGLVF